MNYFSLNFFLILGFKFIHDVCTYYKVNPTKTKNKEIFQPFLSNTVCACAMPRA